MVRALQDLLTERAARAPAAICALEPDGASITYEQCDAFSEATRAAFAALGASPGDRIGICAPKNIAALASVFGALKAGCAYVPVDYAAPAARNGYIFDDCDVKAIVAHGAVADALQGALRGTWRRMEFPAFAGRGRDLVLLGREETTAPPGADALAYILYTSGSTGRPKGVMHSHATALAFIDWCSALYAPTPADVFSSHAPFHFDLSILDLYVPLKHGASVVLIDAETGKQPGVLADMIAARKITAWYSTPSILRMLVEYGDLAKKECGALRIVSFAGEVFPIKHLRALMQAWPHPDYYNLYGPTETNVCTYHKVAGVPAPDAPPLPIGRKCSNDETRAADAHGADVAVGEEGELLVAGGSVMLGYWNLPERNEQAFIQQGGASWYRTGDIVRDSGDGVYELIGRRDRMVKRRGYRIELGEIEAALLKHPDITEAAAVAKADAQGDVEIHAFLAWTADKPPSVIKLKQFCAQHLPIYMSPDRFKALAALPKTSTDKTDYQRLKEMA